MFHSTGTRFTSSVEVLQKIRVLEKRWNKNVAPAIVHYAIESGKERPASKESNGKTIFSYNKIYITHVPNVL